MLAWTIAGTEAEREEAARLICRNGANLGLLYNWCTVMNSIAYCIEDDGGLIGRDRSGAVRGILAHTIGTLDDGYKDKGRIEIHLFYVEEPWRSGRAVSSAIRVFVRKLLELPQEVKEIVFFTPATDENRRMYGRSATLSKTTEPPCGRLDFYSIGIERLLRFDSA